MNFKKIIIISSLFPILFSIVLFLSILVASSDDDGDIKKENSSTSGMNLSPEVLEHKVIVEKYAREYDISDYVQILLAIMQVESGGKGKDVMQSSESMGLPPNSLDTESSIKQGCKHFASLFLSANSKEVDDINAIIQAYNYGGGYLDYLAINGKKHEFQFAEKFAHNQSGGKKVSYPNPIAIAVNGGWRYDYGNMFYVELVKQYLTITRFDDETVQQIMDEALKYNGWSYVFGGYNPNTGFDCSGLIQWCYGLAGISLPRVAQDQYDATQHISMTDAKPGDLIFFHSTYDAGAYVTHVGIYISPTKFYQSGSDGIGYADLQNPYWQEHLIGAGRIKK